MDKGRQNKTLNRLLLTLQVHRSRGFAIRAWNSAACADLQSVRRYYNNRKQSGNRLILYFLKAVWYYFPKPSWDNRRS
jgi:hypothetical protein